MKRINLLLVGILFLSTIKQGAANEKWLAVIATEKTLDTAVEHFKKFGGQEAGINLIDTSDCTNLEKKYFLVVAGNPTDKISAERTSQAWKTRGINDPYARKCEIKQKSRLYFDLDLLDKSIYDRPNTVVNWDYSDAISSIKILNDSLYLLIQPKYAKSEEDVREGLKINVSIITKSHNLIKLQSNCIDPEFSAKADTLAIQCTTSTMADNLLHTIYIYRITNYENIFQITMCRNPIIINKNSFSCKREIVDNDGLLFLKKSIININL